MQRDKQHAWRASGHVVEVLSQPATPSKSKLHGRRGFCSFTGLLVGFALLAGLVMLSQEVAGGARTETYYRKAMVAKMTFGAGGQAVTAASEEFRSSSSVGAAGAAGAAAADADLESHPGGLAARLAAREERAALELGGGGGGMQAALAQPREGAAAVTQQQQQQQQQQQPAAEAAAASAAAQLAASQAAGQEEEQEEAPEPEPTGAEAAAAWYSNVLSPDGKRLPPMGKREHDNSASLATAITFDESAVPDSPDCKIAVLDVDKEWGHRWGAGACDLSDPRQWPFAAPGRGIDGADALAPHDYQYSAEHWIAQAIRNSSRYTADASTADFIFVDMHCYHAAWLAWLHPLNEAGRAAGPSPEYWIRRALTAMQGMKRFKETKGGAFAVAHPAPLMKGLLDENAACDDLASVLHLVPERSMLCVWTRDSHRAGKSVLLPYAATTGFDIEAPVVPSAERETFLFFQGGCGNPDPSVRHLFAAGKMLRWALVRELQALAQPDIHAKCSCDICEGHMPHDALVARMGRSVFCPVPASNTQSSRRLSEAVLTGCIPVFIGEPFHSLPLAGDVDYKSFAVFLNVSEATWVNASSPKWEHNHMIRKAWSLDDPSVAPAVVQVPTLAAAVRHLRAMPAAEVAARQAALLAARLRFYYPPASAAAYAASGAGMPPGLAAAATTAAGGAGTAVPPPAASELGELLMRKMCHRAAAVSKRLAEAASQGVDFGDSDEKIEHPTLAAQARSEGEAEAEAEGGSVPAAEQAQAAAAVAAEVGADPAPGAEEEGATEEGAPEQDDAMVEEGEAAAQQAAQASAADRRSQEEEAEEEEDDEERRRRRGRL